MENQNIKQKIKILPAEVIAQRRGNCPIWKSGGVSKSGLWPAQAVEDHSGSPKL